MFRHAAVPATTAWSSPRFVDGREGRGTINHFRAGLRRFGALESSGLEFLFEIPDEGLVVTRNHDRHHGSH
jgi:hypothetical protein